LFLKDKTGGGWKGGGLTDGNISVNLELEKRGIKEGSE
jgi:hypothetical protein